MESNSLALIDIQGLADSLAFVESPSKFVALWSARSGRTWPSRQKWQRSSHDNKFHLRSFSGPDLPATLFTIDRTCIVDALKEEEHLEVLELFPNATRHLSSAIPSLLLLKKLTIAVSYDTNDPLELHLLSSFPSLQTLFLDIPNNTPLSDLTSISPPLHLQHFSCENSLRNADFAILFDSFFSKAKNFSHLELRVTDALLSLLSSALPRLSSLTSLCLRMYDCVDNRKQFFAVLPSLPLRKLELQHRGSVSEDELVAVFNCLTLRDLTLEVDPRLFSTLADLLLSGSPLTSLQVGDAQQCESELSENLLNFFSALSSSSIRSLTLNGIGFMQDNLEDCLNLLPSTKLSFLCFDSCVVRENLAPPREITPLHLTDMDIEWNTRFPEVTDRFCLIKVAENW
jgi:hypothetical protein